MNNIVYILGAGCSAFKDGYPLARDFREALTEYRDKLGQRPNCERLKQCLTNTVSLMEQYQSPTVDRLVSRILEELARLKRPLSSFEGVKHERLEQFADNQILDAKRATVALFLDRETSAQRSGLQGYRDFLNIIFEGNRDSGVLKSTASRVLSFNYDRLFEIAFGEFFRLNFDMSLYAQPWLNSGIDFLRRQAEDVDVNRFSLLKLHGTAGLLVAEQYGQTRYGWNANLNNADILVDNNLFWPTIGKPTAHPRETPEPLITFPVEKDRARSGDTSFLFDNYLRAIWGHHGQPGYAEQLIHEAEKIWVIGYSFDPNDRKAMIELLRKSGNCPIYIRNRTKEEAQRICDEELVPHYDDLAPRFRAIGNPF